MVNLHISGLGPVVMGTGLAAGAVAAASSKGAGVDAPQEVSNVAALAQGDGRATAPSSASGSTTSDPPDAKKAPPPASAIGTQYVYVFDDQLHKSVVKILDIETQKVMADTPAAESPAQTGASAFGAEPGPATNASSASSAPRIDTTA